MAKFAIELNEAGVRELLRSEKMKKVLSTRAKQACGNLGQGYAHKTYVMKTRAVAKVGAVTAKAKRENAKTNSILKALR